MARNVARGLAGQIEDAMADVEVAGKNLKHFNSQVIDLAIKDMGGKPTDVYDVFGDRVGKDKVASQIKDFLVASESNPDKAAEELVRFAYGSEKTKILASIAAKLKPDAARALEKAAKSAGVAIGDCDLS